MHNMWCINYFYSFFFCLLLDAVGIRKAQGSTGSGYSHTTQIWFALGIHTWETFERQSLCRVKEASQDPVKTASLLRPPSSGWWGGARLGADEGNILHDNITWNLLSWQWPIGTTTNTYRALRWERQSWGGMCDEFKPARASHLQQGQRKVHRARRRHIYRETEVNKDTLWQQGKNKKDDRYSINTIEEIFFFCSKTPIGSIITNIN